MNGGNSLSAGPDCRRKVVYYYEPDVGNYDYDEGHVMKPHRVTMVHELLQHHGVTSSPNMKVLKPCLANEQDLLKFHDPEYVKFLKQSSCTSSLPFGLEAPGKRAECPFFEGLYRYCQTYAGGSICAAKRLSQGDADIVINWSGGLHHAKKAKASGFCYVNDIVLAILELLRTFERVLYIDIDAHHGDGVEEAFYVTDRVMTVSFHKFGSNYFPGTGDIKGTGLNKGKYYAVNVPLDDGVDDDSYHRMFKPIISKVMEVYQPGAVVLQCGADSLARDILGTFNLSVKGHAECVSFVRSFSIPLMLVGGGGYVISNVAKCWCYETGVAVGMELPYEELHNGEGFFPNSNSPAALEKVKQEVLANLSKLKPVPSVQFQEMAPSVFKEIETEEDQDMQDEPDVETKPPPPDLMDCQPDGYSGFCCPSECEK